MPYIGGPEDRKQAKEPTKPAPEIRIATSIILACLLAIIIALVYRLVRWIAGF